MSKAVATRLSRKKTMVMGHFPGRNNLFLRYAASPCAAGHAPCPGTIILLSDWGSAIESNYDVIAALNARGFHVVTYEWHAQGNREPDHNSAGPFSFCFHHDNLDIFFHHAVLPDFPPPFFVLAKGTGGLFALTAHDILRSQIHRMIVMSPVLEVQGHQANSFYHQYMRFRSLIRLNRNHENHHQGKNSTVAEDAMKQSSQHAPVIIRPTPHWCKMVLNAAACVLSPDYCKRMALPTLFILSTRNCISSPRLAREFTNRLRMAECITIHGASHDILDGTPYHCNQFWKAFDTFIPGSGTAALAFNHLLEGNMIL